MPDHLQWVTPQSSSSSSSTQNPSEFTARSQQRADFLDTTRYLTEPLPSEELFDLRGNKGADIAWKKFSRKYPAVARFVAKTPGQTARDNFLWKASKRNLHRIWEDPGQPVAAGDSAVPEGAASAPSSSAEASVPADPIAAEPVGFKRGLSQSRLEADSSPSVRPRAEPSSSVAVSRSSSPAASSASDRPPSVAELFTKARELLSGTSHAASSAGDSADYQSVCSEISCISESEVKRLESDVRKWSLRSRQSRARDLGRRSQSLRREPLDIDISTSSEEGEESEEDNSFEADPLIEDPESPKGAPIPEVGTRVSWTRTGDSAGYGRWSRRTRTVSEEVDPSL